MAAKIASPRVQFNRSLDKLYQRTQRWIDGTDRQIDNVHSTINTLSADMITIIDEITSSIDNHESEAICTELDDYNDRHLAASRSTVSHRHPYHANKYHTSRHRF